MAEGDEPPSEGHAMGAEAIPDWMRIPQGHWTADDLDLVPEEVGRCEVLDGALIVMSPQREFHSTVMWKLAAALNEFAHDAWRMHIEMTIRIDKETRLEPDVLVATSFAGIVPARTWFWPVEVALAVEIVSPESEHRDRVVKHAKYARAAIPHYWRIEEDHGVPVVHAFELDPERGHYLERAVEREKLTLDRPFPMTIDVDRLYP